MLLPRITPEDPAGLKLLDAGRGLFEEFGRPLKILAFKIRILCQDLKNFHPFLFTGKHLAMRQKLLTHLTYTYYLAYLVQSRSDDLLILLAFYLAYASLLHLQIEKTTTFRAQ